MRLRVVQARCRIEAHPTEPAGCSRVLLSRESSIGAPQVGTGTSSGGSITTSPGSGTSARLNRRLTNLNNCMAEGRKAFLTRFAELYGFAG
jgi:hypothetical protein